MAKSAKPAAKSLKAANLKWLWSAVALDAVVALLVASPELLENLKPSALLKSALLPAGPVIVLLLSWLVPSDMKAILVFWRVRHVYPGHRAFSEIAPKDSRFRMEALAAKIGLLPEAPEEQNTTWFKLYKAVQGDVTVTEPHQAFLLLRELASMSCLLVPVALVACLIAGLSRAQTSVIVGLFALQYLLSAIAARNSGTRLVANVLALHAV